MSLSDEESKRLAKAAAEWVRSPEGQEIIRKSLEAAQAITNQMRPKPLTFEQLHTPFI